jgi:SAM-dependent methyltransferase
MSDGKPGDEFYDDESVFGTYTARRQNPDGPNERLERPIIEALVGDVQGQDVLDLGCGAGPFGVWAFEHGAASYTGVDASTRMIAAAAERLQGTNAALHRATIQTWEYPSSAFDLIVSRLSLHYVERLVPALRSVRGALRDTGRLVCSVEHPVLTSHDESGRNGGRRGSWLVDRYFEPGPRATDWMGGRVIKYHRTVEDYFQAFGAAGLRVDDLRESAPDPARFTDPTELARRRRIPLMLFFAASVRREAVPAPSPR